MRHSPGAATLEIAPTAVPPATTMRRSNPDGRDQLLQHGSVPLEPEPVLERMKVAAEGDLVLTELDVAAPAPEPRLDDERALPVRHRAAGMKDAGARVRQPRALQHFCRQELVVGGQQRSGAVEDADAARGQRAERPEPVLDAVEPFDDVEPAERNGARLQQRRRLLGREDPRVDAARSRSGERDVRGSTPLGDDRKQHGFGIAENNAGVGYRTVKIRCASGSRALRV